MEPRRSRWFAVLALHVSWFVWSGLSKGLGVMLPSLQEDFDSSAWVVGEAIALITGVCDFAGPLAGPLEERFGTRAIVMLSGFLVSSSLVAASMTTAIWQFTLAVTFLSGVGLSLANIVTRAAVARVFTDHYALASGIGHSGHSIALLVFAPLTQLLLDTYGWRGAMLIMGGLFAHLLACGALLGEEKPSGSDYSPLVHADADTGSSDEEDEPDNKPKCCGGCSELVGGCQPLRALGGSILYQPAFWITASVYVCNRLVAGWWIVYFVDHAYAKGISGPEAVTITAAAGLANLLVKLGHGPLVDSGWVGLRTLLALLFAVAAACLFVDPLADTFWPQAVVASVYLGAAGAIGCLLDLYTRDLVGSDHVATAFGWMGLLAGAVLCSIGFVPGWMSDASGSYDSAFVLMGGIWCIALAIICLEWLMRHRSQP